MNKSTQVLVSGAVLFKEQRGKLSWFIVKLPDEEAWEFPKVLVRRGESSVRAALRMMGEKGGMTTKVLEEAGRAGGVTTVNDRTLPQRYLYYLMVMKTGTSEPVGFPKYAWFDYAKAARKLSSKREKQMLKSARSELKKWKKKYKKRKLQW